MNQDINQKIEDLQTKVSFQDHTIEELNQALTEQQKLIDKMEFQIKYLADKLKQNETSNIATMSEEAPPPHY